MAETAIAASPTGARSAQRRRRLVGLAASAALALGGAVVVPAAAQAADAETPSFTATVTEVPDDRIDIAIEGTGYGDVPALPGQSEPHAYFTLIEKGADLADVTQGQAAISAGIDESGNVSGILPIPAENLDASAEYEVISWPSRSNPTAETLYARTDITIDWAALFPAEVPTWDPQLTVAPATDLNPAGDTVTVTGTGYNPAQGLYVFLCEDVELPADLWQLALGCRTGAALTTPSEDGTFELELDVEQLDEGPTSVYTAANHTAQADRTQDAKASLAFAEPVEPQPEEPQPEEPQPEEPQPEEPQPEEPVLTLTGPDGEELTSITQGDEVTFTLGPVDAGTEFEVTIQSDPITLPAPAIADADGIASATWTVAEDFEPGEHTVTFASDSDSYSVGFEVLAADSAPGSPDGAGSNGTAGDDTTADESPVATGAGGSASDQLAVTGAGGAEIALSAAALLMLLGAGVLVRARRRARAAIEN